MYNRMVKFLNDIHGTREYYFNIILTIEIELVY